MHRAQGLAIGGIALLVSFFVPRTAHACGGFFCQSVPVVQSGEQIVYVVADDGSLTMSVRIDYAGAAPEFAWILPVPETPTLSLGTTALFDALDLATRPQFRIGDVRTEGTCRAYPECEFFPRDAGAITIQDASFPAASDAGSGGPTIYGESSLGPYETVVIGGASATEIHEWLTAHGYDLPSDAVPLLDDYVTAGQRFVALRLRNDATISEIQPITLGFGVLPPCLPIRLTAIATQPDLPITAFFLARTRATARNYSSIETPPPGALWTGALSYTQWVSNEADDLGGQAFITDFAGPTSVEMLVLPPIDDLRGAPTPEALVGGLIARGYASDGLLLGILARYLPPPPGSDPTTYLNCLARGWGSCGDVGFLDAGGDWDAGAPVAADPSVIVDAIEAAIREPRARAQAWMESSPYTTRLYTTMSAEEMTMDPEFVLDDGLGDVSNLHDATLVTECDAAHYVDDARQRLELPGGRTFVAREARTSWSDALYCERLGGWVRGTDAAVAFDAGAGGPREDAGAPHIGGAGGCSVSHVRGSSTWLVLSLLALSWRRRARARG